MTLSSELDVLLATARELSRARQDAHHQIGQLEEAIAQAREGLKQTNALAAQITQRLRELAKRQGLLPPSSRAGSLDLVSLAAQTTQALAANITRHRAPNVVALRSLASSPVAAAETDDNDQPTLPTLLREVLETLDERDARVLRLSFGLARRDGLAADARGPLPLTQVAKLMGQRLSETNLRLQRALLKLRHPSRANRLRPHFNLLDPQAAASREALLLQAVFGTRQYRE